MRTRLHSVALQQCLALLRVRSAANVERYSIRTGEPLKLYGVFIRWLPLQTQKRHYEFQHFIRRLPATTGACLGFWFYALFFFLFHSVNGGSTTARLENKHAHIFVSVKRVTLERVITSNNKNALSQISSSSTSSHFSLIFSTICQETCKWARNE